MKVIVSKHSGFCFGVKRAVGLTKNKLKNVKKIRSLGPLIHNKWVVSELSRSGLRVIKDLKKVKDGYCVVLPSHGVDAGKVKNRGGLTFVDTTCPFVFKAQTLIKKLAGSGYEILILGDKNHPEVKGLVGISNGKARVIASVREAASYKPRSKRIAFVSQTTQSVDNFVKVSSLLLRKDFKEFLIYNTICNDVIERQEEARQIASKVDVMLVIGGKNSANTKRLANVCGKITKTYHVEDEKEINNKWFKRSGKVGIVTGASTPGEFIEKVRNKIKAAI